MAAKLGIHELNEAIQIHKPYNGRRRKGFRTLETLPAYSLAGERLTTHFRPRFSALDVYALQTYDLQCFFFRKFAKILRSLICKLFPVFGTFFNRFIRADPCKIRAGENLLVLLGFAFFYFALPFICDLMPYRISRICLYTAD